MKQNFALKDKILFDFQKGPPQMIWFSINDGVMGGKSTSAFQIDLRQGALFSGNVSPENNGGFSSVRSAPTDFNLGGFKGLEIRVQGDGKNYKIRLKTDEDFNSIVYEAEFETLANQWTEHQFLFSEFQPKNRGQVIKNITPINPASIKTFSFLISGKQYGPFELLINWIKAI